jgi:16S rRNA (guanine(966)-N(2))-methyltransferase RsmD
MGEVRVIGGTARGRILQSPPGDRIRPTLDRVREALFNILAAEVDGTDILDGYAGSGSVGIEALSRGGRRATFVERDAVVLRCLRRNLEKCGFAAAAHIRAGDCRRLLPDLERDGEAFDLVFLDPPYADPGRDRVLRWLGKSNLLRTDGVLILEHSARDATQVRYGRLMRRRECRYGDTRLSFFRPERAVSMENQ